MDGKLLARLGAAIFVGLAVTATAIDLSRSDSMTDMAPANPPSIVARDPLAAQLARCAQAGEAGAHDPQCLKAWADNRRRFLGQDQPSQAPIHDRPEVR